MEAHGQLVLVTSRGCHFCEHGKEVLATLGLDYVELDVADAEALALAAAGVSLAFLPVLVQAGRLLAYGRLSEKRLRKEFSS